jgi:hypothetical protein
MDRRIVETPSRFVPISRGLRSVFVSRVIKSQSSAYCRITNTHDSLKKSANQKVFFMQVIVAFKFQKHFVHIKEIVEVSFACEGHGLTSPLTHGP